MSLTPEQVAHLNEHVDQFVAITGAESVEAYFTEFPEATYEAACAFLGIEPKIAPADEKAHQAFEEMTPREHRKAAQHLLLCPHDGLMAALGVIPAPFPHPSAEEAVLGALAGKPMGDIVASKVENLTTAQERLNNLRALIDEAETHIVAAIEAYKAQNAQ